MSRLSIFTFVFLSLAWAQSTAVISGTIEDPTGGLVPGAAVTAIQQQTDQRFDAVSDSQGRFSFPRLPVGNYKVQVSRTGFRRFESEALLRRVAERVRRVQITADVGVISPTFTPLAWRARAAYRLPRPHGANLLPGRQPALRVWLTIYS
jgi:Carboxypeptidase regulatory-like domain